MSSFSPRIFHSVLIGPLFIPFLLLFSSSNSDNHPPVALDDAYTVHCCAGLNVTANDSDADNEVFFLTEWPSTTAHGTLVSVGNGVLDYRPNSGYVGPDDFTYKICDGQHACGTATVSINVVNEPPNGVTDLFNVHGFTVIGPFLANDSDPDNDGITCGGSGHDCLVTFPQHGELTGVAVDRWAYRPNVGYSGPDTLTYNVCDGLGLCTTTTVNISVNNQSPIAGDDSYEIPDGSATIGPFLANDSDPDGDGLHGPNFLTFPQHGSLSGVAADRWSYRPEPGFNGDDIFQYQVCDDLGACATATVTLHVGASPTPTPTPTPVPTATPTPTPPPPPPSPTPTPTPPKPLIFIPGVAGSRLNERLDDGHNRNLWPGLSSVFPLIVADKSRLTLDPLLPHADIFAPDIIRTVPARALGVTVYEQDYYGSLMHRLAQGGYREYQVNNDPTRRTASGCDLTQKSDDQNRNPNLFVFAYDWRLSNGSNALALKSYVECVKKFYPDSKINILTHSNGGLLARRYILDNPGGAHNVDKLITIAAPWLGAPKAINVLETGQFGIPETIVTDDTLKALVRFFKSAHEILPAASYFSLGGDPFGEKTWDINSDRRLIQSYTYSQFVALLDNLRFTDSKPGATNRSFHTTAQDDWRGDSTGVKYFHFFGNQRLAETIGKMTAVSRPLCDGPGTKCKNINEFAKTFVRGDGTVPLLSAERKANGLDLNAPNAVMRAFTHPSSAVEHTALAQNPDVFAAIQSALNSDPPSQAKNLLRMRKPLAHHRRTGLRVPQGQEETTDVARYVNIWGVNQVTVEDSLGNRNDPIPGTPIGDKLSEISYDLGLNSVSVVTPADQLYTLTFESTGEPMFVEIVKGVGNEAPMQAIRYLDLNLPIGTRGLLRLSPSGVDDLRYDSDGDGVFESSVLPTASVNGDLALDTEAPVITFSGEANEVTDIVSLAVADDGSGVRNVRYSFDGETFQQYGGPLSIDPRQVRTIFAFADDNVGNRSQLAVYDVPLPPSIISPPDITGGTVGSEPNCGMMISDEALGNPSAHSNSSGTVTITRAGVPANNFFPVGVSHVTYTATDSNGLIATATQTITVTDNTPPTISCPGNFSIVLPPNSSATSVTVSYPVPTASDNCETTMNTTPAVGAVFPVGNTQVIAMAADSSGNTASCVFDVSVLYLFSGFFSPVNNLPTLNSVNAGRAIPIKFSLSGNKGLNIFAAAPASGSIGCGSLSEVELTETLSAGNSSLSYEASSDQYVYVWKTESSWAGSCRQFLLQLNDGSIHRANFRFK